MWIWSGDITTGLREYEAGLLNELRGKGVENHPGDILTYRKDSTNILPPSRSYSLAYSLQGFQ